MSANALECPNCPGEDLIIAEAEFDEEPAVGYCPECGHTEVVRAPVVEGDTNV